MKRTNSPLVATIMPVAMMHLIVLASRVSTIVRFAKSVVWLLSWWPRCICCIDLAWFSPDRITDNACPLPHHVCSSWLVDGFCLLAGNGLKSRTPANAAKRHAKCSPHILHSSWGLWFCLPNSQQFPSSPTWHACLPAVMGSFNTVLVTAPFHGAAGGSHHKNWHFCW